ncbi:tRNA (adenosine(37)-N6)-threonylcarbamoyltransferase complex dimerization subunit type 1 TsaB [Azonexus sp.]|jgi:tRNA threonylcarbamoyladenosine biosynthesis protein TsaB|uniref:tRNA (adenosine(37)-N6)-threonylcarbamoyltransferase complex dimerization subunit type 1 TsaB n=1 Tax=Azonexus sp. TaxID=1872668 RepID=UPI00281F2C4B|nr:tRNA (adenosine(37)-N6)-threonylcarbamoyltransferase complex dimerization subunit type 1 TsaB [Azonexus sp.]MDR1994257.1 tRNA (adenosine(37)-N6)-threonylcarbamoyltransferase complex dimerization subunit type 1 TsaB [Azonexus sp.]
MLILALETSTELGSCALWRDGAVLERRCPAGRAHSETLLPLVRELLGEAGIGIAALDAIAFGAGPGAFTGLRVACGAAQGLAVAVGRPLLPVTSLEAMALQAGDGEVLALLDARMGEVYAGRYRVAAGDCHLQGEIGVLPPAELPLPDTGGWRACGNAPAAYPLLRERLQAAGIALLPDILPTAAAVAALAAPRVARGEGIDAALAAPLYVRDKVAKTVAERLGEGGRA